MSRKRLIDGLWLAALAAYALAGVALAPFHADESTQLFMSRDYACQFLAGDLAAVAYAPPPRRDIEQELRLINGTLNKYLIGLAWHSAGFALADLNRPWDWGADWDYNQRSGHIPADALLLVARWPSALLLAAGVAVMFALGGALAGRPAAYSASLFYALHPALLLNGRRAMMEGSYLFFTLAVVLAGIWFIRRPSWRAGLLLGMAGGLALASKHTALATLALVLAVCLVAALVRLRQAGAWRGLSGWALAAGLAALVFYLLNPAWWGDPLRRAGDILALRADLLQTQVSAFGGYDSLADQLAGFARQALIALPQYYEAPGWDAHIGAQIAAYEASPWRGVSMGGSAVGGLILALLAGAGGWRLWRDTRHPVALRALVGLWALGLIAVTLLLTPLEWQRYYVPVYPALGLLAALGVAHLAEYVRYRWRTG